MKRVSCEVLAMLRLRLLRLLCLLCPLCLRPLPVGSAPVPAPAPAAPVGISGSGAARIYLGAGDVEADVLRQLNVGSVLEVQGPGQGKERGCWRGLKGLAWLTPLLAASRRLEFWSCPLLKKAEPASTWWTVRTGCEGPGSPPTGPTSCRTPRFEFPRLP